MEKTALDETTIRDEGVSVERFGRASR
jgi:hypothetical protein